MSGQFTDSNFCSKCGEEIKDGERVVVTQITDGTYDSLNDNVNYDAYDRSLEISHERCYKGSEGGEQKCESTSVTG